MTTAGRSASIRSVMSNTLRLISLNTWGGRALHPLLRFLKAAAEDTDIFCLQEMFCAEPQGMAERHPEEFVCADLYPRVAAVLHAFQGAFAAFDHNPYLQSQAIFVRKGINVRRIADLVVHQPTRPQETGSAVISARKLQHAAVDFCGRTYTIANLHGLWNGGSKTDAPERIVQSQNVRSFLQGIAGPKILCGDFNLLPDTQSLRMMEEGMVNLVRSSAITSTRTPLYRHFHDPAASKFADYMLVSPDVTVHKFAVLPYIASDHSPLFLEFS